MSVLEKDAEFELASLFAFLKPGLCEHRLGMTEQILMLFTSLTELEPLNSLPYYFIKA